MAGSKIWALLILAFTVVITLTFAQDPPDWTVCQWKGSTHRTGEEWDDGCNRRCKCVKATMNHTECFNICPRIRHHPNVCKIVNYTSPGNCYKPGQCDCPQVECPWDCKCQYKGEFYGTGDQWFDRCKYRCGCISERRNLISCTNRCTKIIIVPPGCKLVKPKGKCCEELCCDGNACPVTHVPIKPTSNSTTMPWTAATTCFDVVENCKSYGRAICQGSNRQWAQENCAQYCGMCVTTGGNGNRAICQFPFKYRGEVWNICTVDGHAQERLWCSTTNDYDKDAKWGDCHVNLYKSRCQNRLNNCPSYTKSACVGDYKNWGGRNCERMCGYCEPPTTIAPPTTTPMTTTQAILITNGTVSTGMTMGPQTVPQTVMPIVDTTTADMPTTQMPDITTMPVAPTHGPMPDTSTDMAMSTTSMPVVTTAGVVTCSGKDGSMHNVGETWFEDECETKCTCGAEGTPNCQTGYVCPEDTAPPLAGSCQWVLKDGDCCKTIECPTKPTLGPTLRPMKPTNGSLVNNATDPVPTIPVRMNVTVDTVPTVNATTPAVKPTDAASTPPLSTPQTVAPPVINVTLGTTPPAVSNATMSNGSIGSITDAPMTSPVPIAITMDSSYNTTSSAAPITTTPIKECVSREDGSLKYKPGDVWFEYDCKFRCACTGNGNEICSDRFDCPEITNAPQPNCVLVQPGDENVKVCCPTWVCPTPEPSV